MAYFLSHFHIQHKPILATNTKWFDLTAVWCSSDVNLASIFSAYLAILDDFHHWRSFIIKIIRQDMRFYQSKGILFNTPLWKFEFHVSKGIEVDVEIKDVINSGVNTLLIIVL